jgi:hypothetical protein
MDASTRRNVAASQRDGGSDAPADATEMSRRGRSRAATFRVRPWKSGVAAQQGGRAYPAIHVGGTAAVVGARSTVLLLSPARSTRTGPSASAAMRDGEHSADETAGSRVCLEAVVLPDPVIALVALALIVQRRSRLRHDQAPRGAGARVAAGWLGRGPGRGLA